MERITPFLSTTLPIILSAVIAYVTWLYKSEKEKLLSVQNQLSTKKYDVYIKIINLFYGTLENTLKNKANNPKEDEKKMIEIVKELTIYGSDDVVKRFSYWKVNTGENSDPVLALKNYIEIIIALRKDMGHHKTTVNRDVILGMIISNYAKEKKKFDF